ncbi:hypothetical protein INQ51_20070 [Maribellus sp. CM-23]|uniref:sugar-binding domain-containing protein n=1 Tax=Maribellus sp. CM-23 TaxID=2781026 RepID=UPI001F3793E5|nr:sugar-binding domain-containing protein [Maribellus sp. CM-23]MCE4566629.1 hypothetical protein [Maribellus sp. CM-23]
MRIRKRIYVITCLLIIGNLLNCNVKDDKIISRQLFDLNWKFNNTDDLSAFQPDFNDQDWDSIDLPYNWAKDSPNTQIGWYRKHFKIPSNWINKNITLYFEGISEGYEIRVNEKVVSNTHKEKNAFQANISPYLNASERNVVAIRIDSSKQTKETHPSGAGIFGHAWLVIRGSSEQKE